MNLPSYGRKCDEKELEMVRNQREKIKAEYIESAENMDGRTRHWYSHPEALRGNMSARGGNCVV